MWCEIDPCPKTPPSRCISMNEWSTRLTLSRYHNQVQTSNRKEELTSSSLEKCSRTKSFSTDAAFSSNELSSSTPLTAIPIDAKMPNPKTLWYRDERFRIGEVNEQHPKTKTNWNPLAPREKHSRHRSENRMERGEWARPSSLLTFRLIWQCPYLYRRSSAKYMPKNQTARVSRNRSMLFCLCFWSK